MTKYKTVKEYAKEQGISPKTVYRWLKNNDIEGKKIKGIWRVKVGNNSTNNSELILTLKSENENLRNQIEKLQDRLQQAQDTIDSMQERSDTIIMQLTRQLENQNHMLEDMRNRSLWTRVKAAFSFAS